MAKESMKAREVKRVKLANRYAHKREEIAAKVKSGEMDHEEAWIALSKLPRNSNPIRQHNRCKITGRPKGYIRLFGISRIQFREMASKGPIIIYYDKGILCCKGKCYLSAYSPAGSCYERNLTC